MTVKVLNKIQEKARVYPSHGVWRGQQIIRVSIINHATGYADIDLLFDEIVEAHRAID